MNVLRELRKFKRKSVKVRLGIFLFFTVLFVVSIYAWYIVPSPYANNLKSTTESWEILYVKDDSEIGAEVNEEVTFSIPDMRPGMDNYLKTLSIRNMGVLDTDIEYELISVKYFGVEYLETLTNDEDIQINGDTINLFTDKTKYPFNVSYTIDKKHLTETYADDVSTPNAVANISFSVSWPYGEAWPTNTTKIYDNSAVSTNDIIDTNIGKRAYSYYTNEVNDDDEILMFTVKITSSHTVETDN